jgi:hypothetical protein
MTRSLSGKINPVKRNHTLDRRRGYRAPTDADVQCPFFADRFFKLGEAQVTDDMVAVCGDNDNEVACDYKRTLVNGQLNLCHRYWKESINGFTPDTSAVLDDPDQTMLVEYDYIREFAFKKAEVDVRVFLRDKNKLTLTDVSWADFPVYGSAAWEVIDGGKTVRTISNTSDSRLVYGDIATDQLTDYEFSVRGHVEANGDGDWVGVVFRNTGAGANYYKLSWDGGDNGSGLRLSYITWAAEITIHSYPAYKWIAGHVYKYTVKLEGNLIQYSIYDETGGKMIASNSTRNSYGSFGTFGVFASSQADAYFYDIYAQGGEVLDEANDPRLNVDLPLSWDGAALTNTMRDYFDDVIQQIQDKPEYADFELQYVEYTIKSDNVLESIYFDTTGTTTTRDPDSQIIIEDYDYGEQKSRTFQMDIPATDTAIKVHDEVFTKDATLVDVRIRAAAQKLSDSFYVAINGNPIYVVDNVIDPTYEDSTHHSIPVNGVVRFGYRPDTFSPEFYNGPSVDTHNKKWRFRGNELGWHKDGE